MKENTDAFAALNKALSLREIDGASRVWVHQAAALFAETERAARDVVAYWDSLDAVQPDDERPTEAFTAEMDRRVNALRARLSQEPTDG